MDTKKFIKIIEPTAKKISEENLLQACGSFRPLAELLIQFYNRKLTEEAVNKYDQSK